MNSKVATFSALLATVYGVGQQTGRTQWTKLNNDGKKFSWVGADIDGSIYARSTSSEVCKLNYETSKCDKVEGAPPAWYVTYDSTIKTLVVGSNNGDDRKVYAQVEGGAWKDLQFPGRTCSFDSKNGRLISRNCNDGLHPYEYNWETGKWAKIPAFEKYCATINDATFMYNDRVLFSRSDNKHLYHLDTENLAQGPTYQYAGPICRTSWLVQKGLYINSCDKPYGYSFNFKNPSWDTWGANDMSPWALGQIGMGRPVTVPNKGGGYLQMPLWAGETQQTARKFSNAYESWDWFNGSAAESNNISIDFASGEVLSESANVIDIRKVYNMNGAEKIKVDFAADLTVSCKIDD